MPCFNPNAAFAEGIILGRLLAGYGELEMEMCACLIAVEYQFDSPVREIFGKPGAEKRIKLAKKLLMNDFTNAGLQAGLAEALGDMDWCREIRNQYAHCQWFWTSQDGLCFVNLESLARQSTPITQLTSARFPVSAALLTEQEDFFFYVKCCFKHLSDAYKDWDRKQTAPRKPSYVFPKPSKVARPILHN
jgi:hypothetical protein